MNSGTWVGANDEGETYANGTWNIDKGTWKDGTFQCGTW
jgi:hypothetical protein